MSASPRLALEAVRDAEQTQVSVVGCKHLRKLRSVSIADLVVAETELRRTERNRYSMGAEAVHHPFPSQPCPKATARSP